MKDASHQEKKDSIMKSLAIIGFIGIIILIAWLSVQLVQVIPNAFTSLASIAESIDPRHQGAQSEELMTFTVTSNTSLLNTNESVHIVWDKASVPGTYTFSYECIDGVSLDLHEAEGVRGVNCDTNYNLGNTQELEVIVHSEKERYVDVTYTISFLGTNDTAPRANATASLTIMNSGIRNILGTTDTSDTITTPVTIPEEMPPAEAGATNPAIETPRPETPLNTDSYEQEFTYTIPVSDPNGRTDLSVRFLNSGTIVGNTFFPGTITQADNGAIQLEVRNLGTKTSDRWDLAMNLPNDGTYNLRNQAPLKPSERAVITIGFPTNTDNSFTFMVTIDEPTDRNSLNDRFSQPITFVR